MAFFDSLKDSLKHKWVQFFQTNRFWIELHSDTVATPDGGKRPASYLILGVISALEPQLAQLMLPFSQLNPDVDALIDVLGLNFDPSLMLGNPSPIQQLNRASDVISVPEQQNSNVVLVESPVGDEESEAFTVISLSELTIDDEVVSATNTEDFDDDFLDIASEPNLDFEQLSSNEIYSEQEQQLNSDQDISHLFPFN